MAADSGNTPLSLDPAFWINFGVLGAFMGLALAGIIWFKPGVDNLKADKARLIIERDAANKQKDELASIIQKEFLPVVSEFTTTFKAFLPLLTQLQTLPVILPALQHALDLLDEHNHRLGDEPYEKPRRAR